jgi:blue light- and temperature-responsive anti-repressor
MARLIQLIYSSTATAELFETDILTILAKSRENNSKCGVTGILLADQWSFFQVLEGEEDDVTGVYERIVQDSRHTKIITIVKEAIPQRAFGEWTMGFAEIKSEDLQSMTGMNDFFRDASILSQINSGRAKKLVQAFKDGRWRSKINNQSAHMIRPSALELANNTTSTQAPIIQYQFCGIRDSLQHQTMAHEIIILKNQVQINDSSSKYTINDLYNYYSMAIDKAQQEGINTPLLIHFMAGDIQNARSAIQSIIQSATSNAMTPDQIILEIDQEKLVGDAGHFAAMLEEFRALGLSISIAHFGAGKAGLTLLETLRPNFISLNQNLLLDVSFNGQRQAIVRGVMQTCNDLGIDIMVGHIKNAEDAQWLKDEGIFLFQEN